MNTVAQLHERPISLQTMESVLGTGDLSKLSVQQRVEYYGKVCQTIGLNPLTRPFRFMEFQGKIVLYATRDATDQLRSLRNITITITDRRMEDELFIVTAQASTPDGRKDEDFGAVTIGSTLKGESRANAIMKAITKAKRRVTLSICGLGFLDESEVRSLDAATFDADEEPPPVDPPQTGRSTQRLAAPKEDKPEPPFLERALAELEAEKNATRWLKVLGTLLAEATTIGDVAEIHNSPTVKKALAHAPSLIKAQIDDRFKETHTRLSPMWQDGADEDPVEDSQEPATDHEGNPEGEEDLPGEPTGTAGPG